MGMFDNRRNGVSIDDSDVEKLNTDKIYNMIERSIQDSIFTEDVYYYAINTVLSNTKLMSKIYDVYEKETKKSPFVNEEIVNPEIEDYTDKFIQWVSNYAMDIVDKRDSNNSFQILSDVADNLVSADECDEISQHFYELGKDASSISKRDVMKYIKTQFGIDADDIEKVAEKCIDSYIAYAI